MNNHGDGLISHGGFDVLPYWMLGNSRADTTTFFQRMELTRQGTELQVQESINGN